MKIYALFALTGLFLIAGCGAPATSDAQPSSSDISKRSTLTVSRAATCQTLMGSDGGLISDSGRFLTDLSDLSESSAKEAADLAGALEGVAETSGDEIRGLLTIMQEPLKDLVDAHSGGTDFTLKPGRFKAAANEIIVLCGGEAGTTTTAEATAAAKAGKTYTDIGALHTAFVAAGGTCKDFFKPKLVNVLPIESGKCGTDSGVAVFYRFSSNDDRDQYVLNVQAVSPVSGLPVHLVVGERWVVDSKEAGTVAAKLGGTLVTE